MELAAIQDELEWSFSGRGVYGSTISMKRLTSLISPIGQVLRSMARDVARVQGRPATDNFGDLIEPVVTDTFSGSFGIRVGPAPVMEQLALEGSLFERTADQVVEVLSAAQAGDVEERVVALLAGLSKSTVNGFKALATQLVVAGEPTSVRWRGDTVVTISTAEAERLAAVLGQVDATDESITIVGILEGGDRTAGEFHIAAEVEGRVARYKGKADPAAVAHLTGLALGASVVAQIRIDRQESPLFEKPRVNYVLEAIGRLGE